MGRQPWIVYQNMRVAEAVTSTRSSTLWIMFGLVIVVYVFVFGSFVAILLKMRDRWRLADEQAGGQHVETPESVTPYGPRPPVPAGDARSSEDGGSSGSGGDGA